MRFHSSVRAARAQITQSLVNRAGFMLTVLACVGSAAPALAQNVDCARLRQQIAVAGDGGGGDRFVSAARKQSVELSRTEAYGHQLGCDRQQFGFFGGGPPPQCGPLNARIAQMQSNLGQLQTASRGTGGRAELIARFNASCRGDQQQAALQPPPRQRGFFESLFGGPEEPRRPPPANIPADPSQQLTEGLDDEGNESGSGAHGGSQAVCVRACDGGFFPLPFSSHHNGESLSEMCTALCPGTSAVVYTRNPNNEIKTAVSLDGTPYMDLPNALKFQKGFDSACTCRPAGKSWAEALASAESVLGNQRKGDIMVTPEKSAELSRPKLDAKTRSTLLGDPGPLSKLPATAQADSAPAAKPPTTAPANQTTDVTGPDGIRRSVRQVGPQL